ncbi:MAG: PAS domain-containing protein [Sterolibacteriaceae bacterium MAG5]|nr:PAS domain-containing protein [Candidatus Nitricoxidireducens bremensis]
MRPPAVNGQPVRSVRALTIVLVYAALSALWILLSDKAVALLFPEPAELSRVSTLKGWFFVAVTSFLLYLPIRRLAGAEPATAAPPPVRTHSLLLPLGLLVSAILALTAMGIAENVAHQREKEVTRLQLIADLQARRIAEWLEERWADVQFLQTSAYLAGRYETWRRSKDAATLGILLGRLRDFARNYGYSDVLLVDEGGRVIGREPDVPGLAGAQGRAPDGDPLLVGPYRHADGRVFLDFVTPLGSLPVRIVLRMEPAKSIYPATLAWPLPSDTGETLLVRREGDQVLALSDLRHRPDSALRLQVPLAAKDLLAARLLSRAASPGEAMEGVDYRGEPVVGVGQPIAGTDWFLIAKLDRSEVYAESMRDTVWIGLAGLLALFVAGAGSHVYRQRQHLVAAWRERETQAERLRALGLLDAIVAGSTDAIFAKDAQGRYLVFNHEAERATGKTAIEVLGRDDSFLFPPEHAAMVMDNDHKVMAEGRTTTFTETLQTADGIAVFLATKGPLRDADGRIVGVFGISRDISERARAEEVLRRNNEELERFNAAMVGRELAMVELKAQVNALARELGRAPPYDLTGMDDVTEPRS